MASNLGDLSIRIKLDGKDQTEAMLRDLSRASADLKRSLSGIGTAMKIDHVRGLLDVRPWCDIGREMDQVRAAFGRLAASGRLSLGRPAHTGWARIETPGIFRGGSDHHDR